MGLQLKANSAGEVEVIVVKLKYRVVVEVVSVERRLRLHVVKTNCGSPLVKKQKRKHGGIMWLPSNSGLYFINRWSI